MATDLQLMTDMLERRGYVVSEVIPPEMLTDKEYIRFTEADGKQVLKFGEGRFGEEGCHCSFYFNEFGDFYEHSSNVVENIASDLDDGFPVTNETDLNPEEEK